MNCCVGGDAMNRVCTMGSSDIQSSLEIKNLKIMSSIQMEENIARVSDIIEQISKLNEMVDFHKNESKEFSMMRQYENMRTDFLQELEQLLI